MAGYRTVLLDADDTLLDFGRAERAAVVAALRAFGADPDEGMIRKYSEINRDVWARLERGEITKQALRTERFAAFCAYYGIEADVPALAACYLESLSRQGFLLDGALAFCRELASHCRLYIITNGIAQVQHGRLDSSPVRPYVKDLFISDELGAEKPHKAFFDEVRRRVPDFDAATTLVVGDSLSSDMAGGIAAGLDTCWYNPYGKKKPAEMPITYVAARYEDILRVACGQ